jgi:FecR protein
MKRLHTIAAYLVALALTGAVTVKSEQPGKVRGRATVRTVTGTATFNAGAGTMALKPNMELDPGTVITTGPESVVYLSVNGLSSSVRVQADTTMAIPQMDRIGSAREGDTETTLDLKIGSILGQVKKVSGNSTYEIKTPHGVAGIRGTDFGVVVIQLPDGKYMVTFTSVQGVVMVSAVVAGEIQVRRLNTGDSWTPGEGEPHPAAQTLLDDYMQLLLEMENIIQSITPPPPGIPIVPPYPTGNPPGGGSSSSFTPAPTGNGGGGGGGGGDE